MPTLTVTTIPTPEGEWIVRCHQYRAWMPKPVSVVDQPALEKSLKSHQSRHTEFVWFSVAPSVLDHLGFES